MRGSIEQEGANVQGSNRPKTIGIAAERTLRCAGIALMVLVASCGTAQPFEKGAPEAKESSMPTPGESLTVVGVRLTQGDGVNCPEVSVDGGGSISVYGLAASVAIGDRVRISGTMAPVASCAGLVLVAKDVTVLERGPNPPAAGPQLPGG